MSELSRRAAIGSILGVCATASFAAPLSDRIQGEIETAIMAVSDADFIAIGETHDNAEHHRIQAKLVERLRPAGLAFEMVKEADEEQLNALRRDLASTDQIDEALNWSGSGWPDFSLYANIMDAAPDAILTGGGVSPELIRAVHQHGPNAIGTDRAARYKLNEPLAAAHTQSILDALFDGHCGLVERAHLSPMLAVQRVWDASFAESWLRAAQRGGGMSVLICGNSHARLDYAAPYLLSLANPEAKIASIGLFENEAPEGWEAAYTEAIVTGSPKREDPCIELRSRFGK